MKWTKWFIWFGVLLLINAIGTGLFYGLGMLNDQLSPFRQSGPRWVLGIASLLQFAWCARGLFLVSRGDAGRVSRLVQVSIMSLLLAGAVSGFYLAIMGLRPMRDSSFLMIVTGLWLLTWIFIVLSELLQAAFKFGGSVCGVARTVILEAIHMKIAIAFIGVLLVALAVLPFSFSTEATLRYRVQTFLTYSIGATTLFLSLLTLFVSCASLSFEIEKKQIYSTATKPIRRGHYLLGKWIGIMSLNAVLLTISGAAIYLSVMFLSTLPARDAYDAMALQQEVLVSRVSVLAKPQRTFEEITRARLQQIEREDPDRFMSVGRGEVEMMGIVNPTMEEIERVGRERMYTETYEEVEKKWRMLEPGEVRPYLFEGIAGMRRYAEQFAEKHGGLGRDVQFLYKVDASGDVGDENQVIVKIRVNGLPPEGQPVKLALTSAQVLPIPAELISDQDSLLIEIANIDPNNVTLTFSSRDPMELLFRRGDFGPNFFRGMLSIWAKLAFLAMLGLATATFLSFPVAVVLSLLIFFAAWASPYLIDSTRMLGNNPQDAATWLAFFLKWIGWTTASLLQKFAEFRPAPLISDGREFSWYSLGMCYAWVGVGWTAIAGLLGWGIYRNRELARVQV